MQLSLHELTQRQRQLPSMTEVGHHQLLGSRLVIFGIGGLGIAACSYLALAGIGTITLVDPDTVSHSNLHRQIIYSLQDVGRPKVHAARDFVAARNRHCEIHTVSTALTGQELFDTLAQHDLALDCTDAPGFSLELNDWCNLLQMPCIFGNGSGLDGQLFLKGPQSTDSCWRCVWPQPHHGQCASQGVLGPVPGVIGSLQALEAIKFLSGCGESHWGTLTHIDFAHQAQTQIQIPKETTCAHNHDHLTLLQRHQRAVFQRVDLPAHTRVIDIRTTSELDDLPTGLDHVPLHLLLQRPQAYLNQEEDITLTCNQNIRSKLAASQLRQQGYHKVYALR